MSFAHPNTALMCCLCLLGNMFASDIGALSYWSNERMANQNYLVDIEFSGSIYSLSLDFAENIAARTPKYNIARDFGTKSRLLPGFRIDLQPAQNHRVSINYELLSWRGTETLKRDVRFNFSTFKLGTLINSEASLNTLTLGWNWYYLNVKDGLFRLSALLEIRFVIPKIKVHAPSLNMLENLVRTIPIPFLGYSLDLHLHKRLSVLNSFSGIAYPNSIAYFTFNARLKFYPIKNLAFSGGVKLYSLYLKSNNKSLHLLSWTPTAGVSLKF